MHRKDLLEALLWRQQHQDPTHRSPWTVDTCDVRWKLWLRRSTFLRQCALQSTKPGLQLSELSEYDELTV